jgi:thimet oligopeptidase
MFLKTSTTNVAFVILSFLLSPTTLLVSGCQNSEGEPIESVLELPEFESDIFAVRATLGLVLSNAESALSDILAYDPANAEDKTSIAALSNLKTSLNDASSRMDLLASSSDNEAVRVAAYSAMREVNSWSIENLLVSNAIYQVLLPYRNTSGRRRLLDTTIDQYERRLQLSETERTQLINMSTSMNRFVADIRLNIDADEGIIAFSREDLDGLTEQQLEAFEYNNVTSSYIVRTSLSSQFSLISSYASKQRTRFLAVQARSSRSKDANADLIHRVIRYRQRIAELLDFNTWADYRISDTVAGDRYTASLFIAALHTRSYDAFVAEQRRLVEMKSEIENSDFSFEDLKTEDLAYLGRLLVERDYNFDRELVKDYFEESATIRGIFDIYEDLFGINISIEENPVDTWADDNQLFIITEDNGSTLGAVYLDLHPRPGKRGHFFMFPLVTGYLRDDNKYQAPVAAIVGNWPPATASRPSLWSGGDIRTMFHEFGHAIHHIFTCAEFHADSMISLPQDFIEAPSQMLERWLEDANVIRRIARHYETGEEIPEDLLTTFLASRNNFPGHSTRGQTSLAFADFRIHSYTSPDQIPADGYGLYNETNIDFSVSYPVVEDTAFLASFGHLFGGYDARYYSYAWSDAIAADLASVFREADNGFFDKDVAARYRKEILEPGGSRDPNELIRNFLGRNWSFEAQLQELFGIPTDAPSTVPSTAPSMEPQPADVMDEGMSTAIPRLRYLHGVVLTAMSSVLLL